MATVTGNEILTIDHLNDVYTKLYDARDRWLSIGLLLKISYSTLKSIEKKERDHCDRCLLEILAHRIQSGGLTWTNLCDSLRKPAVGRTDLADKITSGLDCDNPQIISGDSPSPMAHHQHQGDSGVGEKRKLEEEDYDSVFRNIQRKFSMLRTSTMDSIKSRNISVVTLVSHLTAYEGFRATLKCDNKVLAHRHDDLEKADNIDKVFTIISPFLSFVDFEILEHIINNETLGADSDRRKLAEYTVDLREFLTSWKVEQHTKVTHRESESQAKLCLKLDTDTLDRYRNLKGAIARILNVKIYDLHLDSVDKGCIELVFNFPEIAVNSTRSLKSLRDKLIRIEPRILKITLVVNGEEVDSLTLVTELDAVVCECSDCSSGRSSPSEQESLSLQPSSGDNNLNVDSQYKDKGNVSANSEGYQRTFSYNNPQLMSENVNKKPGALSFTDSGIGKTKTGTRTITSQIDCPFINDSNLKQFHTEYCDLKLSSDEPPPLEKIADFKLQTAVYNGELTKVRFLIDVLHCSPLAVDKMGYTSLHVAAACGKLALLKYFIEDQCVNAATNSVSRETPLHVAASNSHLSIVQYLVETGLVDPLILGDNLKSPLHCACESGDLSTFEYLLNQCQQQPQSNLNEKTSRGQSLLHFGSLSGNDKLLKCLLRSKYLHKHIFTREDINSTDMRGVSALMLASLYGHLKAVQLLLEMGALVDSPNHNGVTALYMACLKGHLKVTETLITAHASVNAQDKENSTPLHWACYYGHHGILRVLLAAKATVNTQDKYGLSPIWSASFEGQQECVQLLIEAGANVDMPNKDGATALHMACQNGHLKVTETLITAHASVNAQNKENITPLHLASRNGHHDILRVLLAAKARVNTQDKYGRSPIWIASSWGHQDCVQLLIKAGANIDMPNEENITSLHWASRNGHHGVLSVLLAAKATVNTQDKYGQSPILWASIGGHLECVQLLIEAGANVDMPRGDGFTALHMACRNGHVKVTETLISAKASVNAQTKENLTPLHMACRNGHLKVTETLITAHASVSAQDKFNTTPLMVAAYNGHSSIVELLLSKRADAILRDIAGKTAFDYAHKSGHKQVCLQLEFLNCLVS